MAIGHWWQKEFGCRWRSGVDCIGIVGPILAGMREENVESAGKLRKEFTSPLFKCFFPFSIDNLWAFSVNLSLFVSFFFFSSSSSYFSFPFSFFFFAFFCFFFSCFLFLTFFFLSFYVVIKKTHLAYLSSWLFPFVLFFFSRSSFILLLTRFCFLPSTFFFSYLFSLAYWQQSTFFPYSPSSQPTQLLARPRIQFRRRGTTMIYVISIFIFLSPSVEREKHGREVCFRWRFNNSSWRLNRRDDA